MWTLTTITAGLFWMAFLAATILPLSSEPALSAALLGGVPAWLCLGIATLGNALGSVTTFYLGRMGKAAWLEKYCRVKPDAVEAAKRRIGRFGGFAAFLCFLPLVGDVFAIALGFMRYSPLRFIVLMSAGKFLRYLVWIILHQIAAG